MVVFTWLLEQFLNANAGVNLLFMKMEKFHFLTFNQWLMLEFLKGIEVQS